MGTHPEMHMEMTSHLLNNKGEHLKKVVLVLDNYLVEGEYWLQNTREVVELLFPHHMYRVKTTDITEQRYT